MSGRVPEAMLFASDWIEWTLIRTVDGWSGLIVNQGKHHKGRKQFVYTGATYGYVAQRMADQIIEWEQVYVDMAKAHYSAQPGRGGRFNG